MQRIEVLLGTAICVAGREISVAVCKVSLRHRKVSLPRFKGPPLLYEKLAFIVCLVLSLFGFLERSG